MILDRINYELDRLGYQQSLSVRAGLDGGNTTIVQLDLDYLEQEDDAKAHWFFNSQSEAIIWLSGVEAGIGLVGY